MAIRKAKIDRDSQLHSKTQRADALASGYSWYDDAACFNVEPSVFEVSQRGDRDLKTGQGQAIHAYNLKKTAEAIEVCSGCPVRATCLEEATPIDLHWTVRGGQWPTSLRKAGQKNVRRRPPNDGVVMNPSLPDQDKCPNGHVAWKSRSDRPGRYCATCSKEAGKRFRQRQKEAESAMIEG